MSIWIAVIVVVVFVGYLLVDTFIRDWRKWQYHGVDLYELAREMQAFKWRKYIGEKDECHVGPGRRCTNCLVRERCLELLRLEAIKQIDEALAKEVRDVLPDD